MSAHLQSHASAHRNDSLQSRHDYPQGRLRILGQGPTALRTNTVTCSRSDGRRSNSPTHQHTGTKQVGAETIARPESRPSRCCAVVLAHIERMSSMQVQRRCITSANSKRSFLRVSRYQGEVTRSDPRRALEPSRHARPSVRRQGDRKRLEREGGALSGDAAGTRYAWPLALPQST